MKERGGGGIPQITNSARIPQHHPHHSNRLLHYLPVIPTTCALPWTIPNTPRPHPVTDKPPSHPDHPHEDQAHRVVQPGAAVGGVVLARDDARQWVGAPAAVDLVAAVRARQAARVASQAGGVGQEGGGFRRSDGGSACFSVGGVPRVVVVVVMMMVVLVVLEASGAAAGVDSVVVGALAD